ncbi:MAG: phosphoribosyl-ATP pyrophosphatase [Microcystaceae cyanobacterium]
MARAYDFWSPMQKRHYNPDGSMKEEYREELIASGTSLFETFARESRYKEEVRQFEQREERYLREYGETFSEMTERQSRNLTTSQLKKRQQLALEEGADLCELPEHMEPDEYYDYYANYPG